MRCEVCKIYDDNIEDIYNHCVCCLNICTDCKINIIDSSNNSDRICNRCSRILVNSNVDLGGES